MKRTKKNRKKKKSGEVAHQAKTSVEARVYGSQYAPLEGL